MNDVTTKVSCKIGDTDAVSKTYTIDNGVASDTAVASLKDMIGAVSDAEVTNIKYTVTTKVGDDE